MCPALGKQHSYKKKTAPPPPTHTHIHTPFAPNSNTQRTILFSQKVFALYLPYPSLYRYPFISLYLSLYLSLSFSLCLSLYFSLSVCCMSLSLVLSLSLSSPLSVCLSVSLSYSLSLSLSLSLSTNTYKFTYTRSYQISLHTPVLTMKDLHEHRSFHALRLLVLSLCVSLTMTGCKQMNLTEERKCTGLLNTLRRSFGVDAGMCEVKS